MCHPLDGIQGVHKIIKLGLHIIIQTYVITSIASMHNNSILKLRDFIILLRVYIDWQNVTSLRIYTSNVTVLKTHMYVTHIVGKLLVNKFDTNC